MAKGKQVTTSAAGTDAATMDDPASQEKFSIEGWNSEGKTEPDDDGKAKPINASGGNADDDDNKDDKNPLLDIAKELDMDGAEEKKKQRELEGAKDDGGTMEQDNLLQQLAADEDNDFTLDDDDDGAAAGEDGKEKKTDATKTIDSAFYSRIAKEIGVDEVQDTEQLIAAIKNRIAIAEAGASAPTAQIDSVIEMQDRDLLIAYKMRNDGMSPEDAEKWVENKIRNEGDEWLETEIIPIRSSLKNIRKGIVDGHVQKMQEKLRTENKFAEVAVEELKNLKTLFGIPLKPHLAELKEFNARLKNPESVAQMRSDAKSWVAGAFMNAFGEKIFNAFLNAKGQKLYGSGWKRSFQQNVTDKILNKGPVRQSTELPMGGDKGGNFSIKAWNEGSGEDNE